MGGKRARACTRAAALALTALLLAPVPAAAQPIGDSALFVWGIAAHAEWEVREGRHVTRFAAYAVRYVSDVYLGQVHTDVGVMRKRCRVRRGEEASCAFIPKKGIDENVEISWDPTMSEVRLNFTYRSHDHAVVWRGLGDPEPRVHVLEPPGLVGVSAHVIRSAKASASIYGDRVTARNLVRSESYMWEGGFTWTWISALKRAFGD